MNYARILRFTNGLLIVIGYQLHYFDVKTRRYRLSVWAIANFIIMSAFYLMAFGHHFEQSALLHLLQDVSPFLTRLMRLQLLIGIKIYLFGIYEQRQVSRAANELATVLPKVFAKKFSPEEAYGYFLNYSTIFISFVIILYVAYEMEFVLPPLDNILIFLGLCIPHFIVAGSLKLYNIGIWLQREQLLEFQAEFQRITGVLEDHRCNKTLDMVECGTLPGSGEKHDLSTPLQVLYKHLTEFTASAAIFNAALRRQILMLVTLNYNCLLGGAYARVYYESTWHLLFMQCTKNVFQATNWGIFILIFWDYLTLCLTQTLFEKVKHAITTQIHEASKQHQRFTKTTRFILADMHELLKKDLSFKIAGNIRMNPTSFVAMQLFFGLIIALIVIYHYLDDQILALSERFDGIDADDD